ncbi:MAG: mechanosensitive ion channel family protein [Gemmatimonadaceae bacterium]
MRSPVLIAVVLAVISSAAARAQSNPPQSHAALPADSSADTTNTGSPVVFESDTLFRLYGHLGPFSAAERAAAVSDRLRQMQRSIVAGDAIGITNYGNYSELIVRDAVLMTVLDADAAPAKLERSTLARNFAARIRVGILAAADRMSTRALLIDTAYALVATIVLVLALRLLAFGFPRLHARIAARDQVRFASIRIQNFELLSAGRLAILLSGAAKLLRVILTLLLLYIYVPLVLSFFPWTASLSHRIVGYALLPFAAAWTGFIQYLPSLFYLIAGIVIVRYLLAFVHILVGAISSGAITVRGFYPDWAEPTYKILRVVIIAVAATVLYPYLPGASTDAFKGVSIFVGVLFSLGSSSAIGNMVAGVVLTYTRAFQIGDRVQIADTVGDVTEKTLLVTRLRTIKNVAVTIPNGAVLSSHVINFSTLASSPGLILHTTVTIGYDSPWRQVHELLLDAAKRTENVLSDPAPFVLQTSLDDFYVSYQLNATTNRADLMAVTSSQLHMNIQETFNEGGVEIMSPHYAALRDGNYTSIPESYRPPNYEAPAFRFSTSGTNDVPPAADS